MKGEHYFSERQASKQRLIRVKAVLRNKGYSFCLSSGVFSAKKIDSGTRLLAESMQIKDDDSVLDLGCGAGIAGRAASDLTKGEVCLTDVNRRACSIAKMNTGGIRNVRVLQGNMFEPVKNKKFDVILLNPPQTAGKMVCFEMIEKSIKHLKKGGSLQLVARHRKGGKELSKKMLEVFGNMETIAKAGGYRVYVSRKS